MKEKVVETPFEEHGLLPFKQDYSPNMEDYEKKREEFHWDEVKKQFSWYNTGKVNIAYEAIDRHAESWRRNKVALYFNGEERKEKYTFKEMKELSNKFANVLKKHGISKGDRIAVFMPRLPELYISFMGIAKTGAIAVPLFQAFMEDAVKDRVKDSEASTIITVPSMKDRIPFGDLNSLENTIIVGENVEEREIDYYKEMDEAEEEFDIEWVDLDDGMVLHYTSGSTGKPKGVLHVHNAMIGHYHTAEVVLDLQEEDVFWCTADPGWVTGTSYGMFGPWLHGTSSVIFGGRFSHDAWYRTIQDYEVTVWYSAPTAFRMLMAKGNEKLQKYDLSSLRLIFSVGEPLNPEVVEWSLDNIGLPIYENWWMTETGMQIIANYPALPLKPGSMGKPVPGIEADIVDEEGNVLPPGEIGNLAIDSGWPSMMHEIWRNKEKYEGYFIKNSEGREWYVSGDSAYKDEDGYFWFEGRKDDIIQTAGERVGPFEVESKLVEHPAVSEAGVVGKPHEVRGNIIKAFVTLNPGEEKSEELIEEIKQYVKKGLAAHAAPKEIEVMDELPKTRSGKIMRRVLRAKETGEEVGDVSTMAE